MTQDTRLVPFSEWYERQGIARSTAFKLLQITGITPAKQRSATSRTPINALDHDQVHQLNTCVNRLKDGETMTQLAASFPSKPKEHQSTKVLGLDLTKATLPDAIAAMVEAWYQAQGVEAAESNFASQPINYNLTESETKVLRGLAACASNEQIAEIVGVSLNTVKSHLSAVMRKLSARDRTHAVVIALRDGLVEYPSFL